jgi:hypothetical protein
MDGFVVVQTINNTPKCTTFHDELVLRSVKMLDICLITVIYLIIAVVISTYIDNYFGKFDKELSNKKSLLRLYIEVSGHFALLAIVSYVTRNVVELIPFPFENVRGYKHKMVKELTSGALFSALLFFFQYHLQDKIKYVIDRTFKK